MASLLFATLSNCDSYSTASFSSHNSWSSLVSMKQQYLYRTFSTLLYISLNRLWCEAFTVSFHVRSVSNFYQRSRLQGSMTTGNSIDELSSTPARDSILVQFNHFLQQSDALRIAGYYYNDDMDCDTPRIEPARKRHTQIQYPPLLSGVKTGLIIFAVAIGMKFYRSIFVNKLSVFERQPAWGSVITSKEDEEKSNLEAMTCNSCGSTLFIAKGRKWFQFPKDYECYACGAKGIENFTNTRQEIKESFDDDNFEYQNPLDLLPSSEKRKWMKLAGGDESKATQLLLEKTAMSEDKSKAGDVHVVDPAVSMKTIQNENVGTASDTRKVKGRSSSKTEDALDLLGMDD